LPGQAALARGDKFLPWRAKDNSNYPRGGYEIVGFLMTAFPAGLRADYQLTAP